MAAPEVLDETPDFLLVQGGPVFRLFRRTHLSGDDLELLHRRLAVVVAIAWLPLWLLSMFGRHLLASSVKPSFLLDVELQVRLLVALPMLIAAEIIANRRIRQVVRAFRARRLVLPQDVPKFRAAIDSATRLRDSVPAELGLLVLVFTVGQWIWRSQQAPGASSWYAIPQGGHLNFTAAGYWFAFVSIPIFQFILLRWYLRFFIWLRFLWRISRLELHLIATHPDRAGGLGFLGNSTYSFSPILFAQGALLAGLIANRVLYQGATLLSFRMEVVAFIGFFLLFILGPLIMFTPQILRAKRKGLAQYGVLASRYVNGFERKWVLGGAEEGDELLGAVDIQSLADLDTSYAIVKEMRAMPFGWKDMTRLAAATAAPLVPLGLLVFSPDQFVSEVIKVLF